MFNLSIGDLADITNGTLRLGTMPPLAGESEPVRRVVLDSHDARPGDVYWAVTGPSFEGAALAENAFAHGALGVVTSGNRVEPWAGKFVLDVADANLALSRLARCLAKTKVASRWLHANGVDNGKLSSELARQERNLLEQVTSRIARRWCQPAA